MQHAITQIKSLTLDPAKPLLVTDADEVLLDFADIFKRYLTSRDLYMATESYALHGNIRDRNTDEPLPKSKCPPCLRIFRLFRGPAGPGARGQGKPDALSEHCQVVVLTNLPHQFGERRRNLFKKTISIIHRHQQRPQGSGSGGDFQRHQSSRCFY